MKNESRSGGPIYVTQPSLPALSDYQALLEGIWQRGILTHNGPVVQQFEREMEEKLGLSRFITVTNGTVALQMAIKALELKGEIIISPFTWVATVSAIKWEGCTPVCCDIDPATFNLDPALIEQHITPNTVAIMPVHVFGNPCEVEAIEAVAAKHGLRVIYDAAHAIGSTWKGKSVLEWGDISATSLHATKLLNSGEGGACMTRDSALAKKLERIRFFGHDDQKEIVEDGFNGKMTEIHAALGLANLEQFDAVLADRKAKYLYYRTQLAGVPNVQFQKLADDGTANYSYFPMVFESEAVVLSVLDALAEHSIYPRRYFYPSVNTLEHIMPYQQCPLAEDLAQRILCLPLYFQLQYEDIDFICRTVLEASKRH